MSRLLRLLLIATCLVNLTACISWVPYKRPDIQQGNIITQTNVDKLHRGMSKAQVIDILGTPVVQEAFNKDELAYIETNQINGGKITKTRLILYFDGGKLASGEGDYKLPF